MSDWRRVQVKSDVEEIEIPSSVYTGSCAELYVFIAQKVAAFARARNLPGCDATGSQQISKEGGNGKNEGGKAERGQKGRAPPLGFCFSFPTEQTSVRRCCVRRRVNR